MTYKEKTRWLGQYRAAVQRQRMLEDELRQLRSDAERVTACLSGMPGRGGPNPDRLPRAVERIDETRKKVEAQIEDSMDAREKVLRCVMAVRDDVQREVLHRHYIVGQSWTEVAQEMGVVQRRVYQLHRAGVEGLEPESEEMPGN